MAWRGNNDRLQEMGIDLPSYFTRCLNVSEQHWNLSSLLIPDYFSGTTCAPPEPEFFDVNKWHTALASYMGSGNTWVRHIIEYISGVVTGSIYVDRDLLNEFKGEGQTENVMVIKTHELASRHRRTYNRAVILLRHPADTIMTLYNYERSRSHTGHVDKWMFEADDWKLFVQSNIFSWQRFYQSWTEDFSGPKFYLSYTRLQTEFYTELLRLAQFLDIPVTFQKLWCLKREMESGYHRNKAPWIDRGSFNKDMMKALNQSASLVKKAFTDVFDTSVEDLI
ncbi:WSCD family member AAEL009094-like [Mya arenaria]|uniref:WSCD family member AAEL009094-like n=1 Tax=Mya arenaria TaxID=6604 RepID=UPI0022E827AA|nr:WSCD family member AAEL009094-like [Mya arenaria]